MQATMNLKKTILRRGDVVFTLLLCFISTGLFGQTDNSKSIENINSVIAIPLSRNGLTESAFKLTARISIERWEKIANIILNISRVQSTPAKPDPSFKYSYNYMGKMYGNQHIGYEAFNGITASDLSYEVTVVYGAQSWTKKVDGKGNVFGPVDRNAKASEVNVYVKVVNMVSFSGSAEIERKIQAYLKGGGIPPVAVAGTVAPAGNAASNHRVPPKKVDLPKRYRPKADVVPTDRHVDVYLPVRPAGLSKPSPI